MHYGFLAPSEFRINWYSFRFTLNVADDGYTRNESCAIQLDIYVDITVDTLAGGLLVHEGNEYALQCILVIYS